MDLLYGSSDDEENESHSIEASFPEQKKNSDVKTSVIAVGRPQAETAKAPGKRILSLASVLPTHILEALTKHPGNDDDSDSGNEDESVTPRSQNQHPTSSTEFSSFLQDLRKVGFSNDNGSNNYTQIVESYVKGATLQDIDSEANKPLGRDLVTHVTTTVSRKSQENAAQVIRDVHNECALMAATEENKPEGGLLSALSIPTTLPASPRRIRVHAAPHIDVHHRETTEATTPTASSATPFATTASTIQDPNGPELPSDSRPFSRKEIERTLRRNTHGAVNIESLWNETGLTQTQQGVDPNLYAPNALPRKAPAPPSGLRNVATHLYDPSTGTTVAQDATGGVGKGRGKNQINHLLAQAVRLERERAEQEQYQVVTGVKMHRANAKRKYGW